MYNCNTDLLGLILGEEVFFLMVTVQEHCAQGSSLVLRQGGLSRSMLYDKINPRTKLMVSFEKGVRKVCAFFLHWTPFRKFASI